MNNLDIYNVDGDTRLSPGRQSLTTRSVLKIRGFYNPVPYVIKQLLHFNLVNMRFYGAEYNNIELGFVQVQ
jgi:hypothetical protein